MNTSQAVRRVRTAALNAGVDADSYKDEEIKNSLEYLLNHFIMETHVVTSQATADLVAENAAIDFSSVSDFRRERLLFAHTTYKDRGVWADATAYLKNELVTGDGTPDARFYRCNQDHTSSPSTEPGSGSGADPFWSVVLWKEGWLLDVVDWTDIARNLSHPNNLFHHLHPHIVIPESVGDANIGRPTLIAFDNPQTGFVYPLPDTVYSIKITYLPTITLTNDLTDIVIPDEYLYGVLHWGGPAALQHKEPETRFGNSSWQKYLNHVQDVRGRVGFTSQTTRPNPDLFL